MWRSGTRMFHLMTDCCTHPLHSHMSFPWLPGNHQAVDTHSCRVCEPGEDVSCPAEQRLQAALAACPPCWELPSFHPFTFAPQRFCPPFLGQPAFVV